MNIELNGFPSDVAEKAKEQIWFHLSVRNDKLAKETVISSSLTTSENFKHDYKPFIRLYSGDESEFKFIKMIFSFVKFDGMGRKKVAVECIKINNFFWI